MQTNLLSELRHRWGIEDGREVGIIDLGDLALVIPGGIEIARREFRQVLQELYEVGIGQIEDPDLVDQSMAIVENVILNDRILIEEILVGLKLEEHLHTTSFKVRGRRW